MSQTLFETEISNPPLQELVFSGEISALENNLNFITLLRSAIHKGLGLQENTINVQDIPKSSKEHQLLLFNTDRYRYSNKSDLKVSPNTKMSPHIICVSLSNNPPQNGQLSIADKTFRITLPFHVPAIQIQLVHERVKQIIEDLFQKHSSDQPSDNISIYGTIHSVK